MWIRSAVGASKWVVAEYAVGLFVLPVANLLGEEDKENAIADELRRPPRRGIGERTGDDDVVVVAAGVVYAVVLVGFNNFFH